MTSPVVHHLDPYAQSRKDDILTIVVVGASGDLAKKKTYPSLLNLFDDNLLPTVRIYGLARSELTHEQLRERLKPYLLKGHAESVVDEFLACCYYHASPSYGDAAAFADLASKIQEYENHKGENKNRLFYFAIPPSVFADTAVAIKEHCMQDEAVGWTRLIVEKPFGRDLESFEELNAKLSQHFEEDHIYRIDHYLGKELVQNLQVLRFSNIWFEKVWNAENIQCVIFTFKEPFGTEGRGGYFDQYGIIRDICQNHLLQVMTLTCMEPPTKVEGPMAGNAVRDAKVKVLNATSPLTVEDALLGQYEGYADDETITNKDTNTPTFCVLKFNVNTPRWHGVPFFMKAGKALDERKAEIRIQFKDAPAAEYIFEGEACPRNELGTFPCLLCQVHSLPFPSHAHATPRSHLHEDQCQESGFHRQTGTIRVGSRLRYPLLCTSKGSQSRRLYASHFGCFARTSCRLLS